MSVTMTEAIHANRGNKTMTQHVADEQAAGETGTQCIHRLQDEIDNPAPVIPPAAGQADTTEETIVPDIKVDIDTMTIPQLKEYAGANGIDLTGVKSKADLIAAIRG